MRALKWIWVACAVVSLTAASTPQRTAASCLAKWQVFAHSSRVPPLTAVAALSDNDVWAIGNIDAGADRMRSVAVHWDGRTLATTTFAWQRARLSDIAEVSADDVWAVGSIGGSSDRRALAAHWDGHRWNRTAVWPWKVAWLSAVAAVGPNDIWAAGGFRKRPLIAHWDGRRWHVTLLWQIAPNFADLRAITAVAPNDVWASGEDGLDAPATFGYGDLELRWDGHRWQQAKVNFNQHAMPDNVADATAAGPNDELWELSSDYSGNGVDLTRWNSSTGRPISDDAWEPASYPDLLAIAPLGQADAWAVGNTEPGSPALVLLPFVAHWNGHSWRHIQTPFDHFRSSDLSDILALSPTDLWAVGNHLIVRYTC